MNNPGQSVRRTETVNPENFTADGGGNFTEYPVRLVFHDDPRGAHYDLFVRVSGQDRLITYELQMAGVPAASAGESGFRLLAGTSGDAFPLTACRKKSHRMHYWTYVGAVAGRGRIEFWGEGWLQCAALTEELFLAWRGVGSQNS